MKNKNSLKIFSLIVAIGLAAGCTNTPAPDNKAAEGGASTKKDSIVYAQSVAITSLDTAGMQPQGYPSGYEAAFAIYNGLVKFDDKADRV